MPDPRILNFPLNKNLVKTQERGKKKFYYTDASTVIALLNEAFGNHWSFEIVKTWTDRIDDLDIIFNVHGRLTITTDRGTTVREYIASTSLKDACYYSKSFDGGPPPKTKTISETPFTAIQPGSLENVWKGVVTDCIKKCASTIGVAAELYTGNADEPLIERSFSEKQTKELAKLKAAIDAGADTVMDLSTGGDLARIRKAIIEASTVPVGTVPIYDAAVRVVRTKRSIVEMKPDELFEAIEDHLKAGVDFITVHCGVTRSVLRQLEECGRLTDVVSRGGSFILEWMYYNQKENPLYERYDDLLDLARTYDATLSLGDGLRPGSLADATDLVQVGEMVVIGELVERARRACVQVMVEGPGHVPLDEVKANVILEKKVCRGAPFYVLGPLVTDIAAGYDHIAGAIGGAVAAAAGADFLCYVTPSEHLRLPDVDDVRVGVIAARIAAHVGDIVKRVPGARMLEPAWRGRAAVPGWAGRPAARGGCRRPL